METTKVQTTTKRQGAPTGPRGPRRPDVKARQVRYTYETKTVAAYLEAINNTPKENSSKTARANRERMIKRLAAVELKLKEQVPAIDRLILLQTKRNLERKLSETSIERLQELEAKFIDVAKDFGERFQIEWKTWRLAKVSEDILNQAGITHTR